jgi:5-(carboxyamino)imidazole ribonucleotide synthase
MTDVPGATIGVVGGGQLGRMLAEAASPLGVEVVVLDPTPDCPAAPPAAAQVAGDFDDGDAIRALADRADVLTYEIELADPDVLAAISDTTGIPVHPAPDTLRTIQDKFVQNAALEETGVPVPAFRAVDDEDDLERAFDDLGSPLMLKRRRGGYDGRGNAPVESVGSAIDEFGEIEDMVAEELVDFERELSVIAVQGDGERRTYPVGENIHREEILRETIVPARTSDDVRAHAHAVAEDVLSTLDGRGVFGIELFEVDDRVLVNEVAPRPHNSGHYTIEGCHVSQFENFARAVLGLPLGDVSLRTPTVMANLLGDVADAQPARLRGVEDVLATDRVSLHWYGKNEVRPLRKMGHVTASAYADDAGLDDLLAAARTARDHLTFDSG